MRFSIITANFNGASFLEETITSVLAQQVDGVDLEYIVVDGGSTDGSLAIIEKYRDSIAHLIVEKDNGPANAINKGFTLATGDVVAWLNADDIYQKDCLKRVQQCFTENGDTMAFCFGGCPIINEQGKEIREGITRFKSAFFRTHLVFCIGRSTIFHSRPHFSGDRCGNGPGCSGRIWLQPGTMTLS